MQGMASPLLPRRSQSGVRSAAYHSEFSSFPGVILEGLAITILTPERPYSIARAYQRPFTMKLHDFLGLCVPRFDDVGKFLLSFFRDAEET